MSEASPALLSVKGLRTWFPIKGGLTQRTRGHVRAVDDVSLEVSRGSTLALVGESGCGKTTVGRSILRLVEPQAGEVRFDGRDLLRMSAPELRRYRQEIQIVFQDPHSSLNPRMRIRDIVAEGMKTFGIGTNEYDRTKRVESMLERVQLDPASYVALSARILRWTASADWYCPGARGRTAAADL